MLIALQSVLGKNDKTPTTIIKDYIDKQKLKDDKIYTNLILE